MASEASKTGTYGEVYGPAHQRHMLAVLARVPGVVMRYRTALSHAFFVSKYDRIVSQALLDHADKYRQLPTVTTLIEDARGLCDEKDHAKVEKVVRALWADDVGDHKSVTDKLVEFGQVQAMVNAVLEASSKIDKGDRNVLGLIKDAQRVGVDLLDVGIDYRNSAGVRDKWYGEAEQEDKNPTGLTHLDWAIDGGMGRGELWCVLAHAKRGKCCSYNTRVWGPTAGYQRIGDVVAAGRGAVVFGVSVDGLKPRAAKVTEVHTDPPHLV